MTVSPTATSMQARLSPPDFAVAGVAVGETVI